MSWAEESAAASVNAWWAAVLLTEVSTVGSLVPVMVKIEVLRWRSCRPAPHR